MTTYEIHRDGIADLALPLGLEKLLDAALHGPNAVEIAAQINAQISEQIDAHGGIDPDGTWPGEWDAEQIVRDVLNANDLGDAPLVEVARAAQDRARAHHRLVEAMAAAQASGEPLRDIAWVAEVMGVSVSHTTVKAWVEGAQTA